MAGPEPWDVHREELGKNINADEAAAMGAVYQAAALSKAFKVKPFVVRDAVIYPILVSKPVCWGGGLPIALPGPSPLCARACPSVFLPLAFPTPLPPVPALLLQRASPLLPCRWSSRGRWRRRLGSAA